MTDSLYDEFVDSKAFLEWIVSQSSGGVSGSSASQKWQQYFRVCSEAEPVVVPAYVFRIVSAALSVPGSNAFCERVFSLMNSKWQAERFRASVALIKSELQVCLNFGMKCTDFHGFALTVRKLLNAAVSGQKYYW